MKKFSCFKFVPKYYLDYNQSPGNSLTTLKHKTVIIRISNFPGPTSIQVVCARGKWANTVRWFQTCLFFMNSTSKKCKKFMKGCKNSLFLSISTRFWQFSFSKHGLKAHFTDCFYSSALLSKNMEIQVGSFLFVECKIVSILVPVNVESKNSKILERDSTARTGKAETKQTKKKTSQQWC